MPLPRPLSTSVLLALVALSGCVAPVSGEGGEDRTGTLGKADGADPQPDGDPGFAAAYRVTVQSVLTTRDREDPGAEPGQHITRMTGWAEASYSDGAVRLVLSPCRLDLPSLGGRDVEIAEEVVTAMKPVEIEAHLSSESDGTIGLSSDTGALLLGVAMERPLGEAMPDTDDDPRLRDADRDGRPGVTVSVDGWRIYVGARASFWLSGALHEDGAIDGVSELALDVRIYGDNIPFYSAREAAEDAAETTEVLDRLDTFEMTPLAEVPSGCAALTGL